MEGNEPSHVLQIHIQPERVFTDEHLEGSWDVITYKI